MRARRTVSLLMPLLALALPAAAQTAPAAGRIKLVSGTASIVRAGAQVPAKVGESEVNRPSTMSPTVICRSRCWPLEGAGEKQKAAMTPQTTSNERMAGSPLVLP